MSLTVLSQVQHDCYILPFREAQWQQFVRFIVPFKFCSSYVYIVLFLKMSIVLGYTEREREEMFLIRRNVSRDN